MDIDVNDEVSVNVQPGSISTPFDGTITYNDPNINYEVTANMNTGATNSAYTSSSGDRYAEQDSSGAAGFGQTYTGEGLGFDAFHSDIHNESFGLDIPVLNNVIDKPYLVVSGGGTIGEFIDEYNDDSFGNSGNTRKISAAVSELKDIDKEVAAEAYFYHDDSAKQTELQKIMANLEALQEAKMAMKPDTFNNAGSLYNDDLEIAKHLQYNRYLESKADAYNANPKKLSDKVYVEEYKLTGYTYDEAGEPQEQWSWEPKQGWDGPIEENVYYTVEKEKLTEQTPTYGVLNNYKAEAGYEETKNNTRITVVDNNYDYIKYYVGWKEFNSIFDLFYTKESLMEKLTGRGVEYSPLTERESIHRYSEGN